MSRNCNGSAHNNWISSMRSDYCRFLEKRRRSEADQEKPPTDTNDVDSVFWYIKQNARTHNTLKYDLVHDQKEPKPVLRRGQTFYLTIRLMNDFDVAKDRVVLNFNFGAKPSVQKGTTAVIPVQNEKFTRPEDDWDCKIDRGTNGKDLMVQVQIPAGAMVGIWHLVIRSGLQDRCSSAMNFYQDETDCYILFNPWCKKDAVYLEDEAKRDEYILNDQGKVYVGAYRRSHGRPWGFGQFDDVVLHAAAYILEVSRVVDSERGNPVKVIRGISAGVKDADEVGILKGRWDGKYIDGVAPCMWTGSVRILEEYVKNGYAPVKYGQCWVFSALVTTLCRALGIPCRSVTNFVSAHDTNSSLTIDKFFDKEGNEIEGGPDGENWDSIWNFHVWNDIWMARPDLPCGYGGWQAVDATPQEKGDRKMQCCGPVSLQALRRGDIGLIDAEFIYSGVNADILYWGKDAESDCGWSPMKMNNYHVGRQILTKMVGKYDDDGDADQEDVVGEYKNSELSADKRLAIHNAIRGSKGAKPYYGYKKDIKEDCSFDLISIDKITVGQPFQFKVVVKNESCEPRTISAYLTARSVYYTGVSVSLIKKAEGKFTLGPKQSQDIVLTIDYNEYWKKLVEQCMLKTNAICRVQETAQTFTDEDDFQVDKPKMQIQVLALVEVKKQCEATFSFTNPLDMPLTECQLSVDGPGLIRPRCINIPKDVPAKGKFSHSIKFLPRIHGKRKLIVNFNAKEIFDIGATKTIKVRKPEPVAIACPGRDYKSVTTVTSTVVEVKRPEPEMIICYGDESLQA